jgi:hypothetical protein
VTEESEKEPVSPAFARKDDYSSSFSTNPISLQRVNPRLVEEGRMMSLVAKSHAERKKLGARLLSKRLKKKEPLHEGDVT